jgi:hypothetical protein
LDRVEGEEQDDAPIDEEESDGNRRRTLANEINIEVFDDEAFYNQ